MLARAATCLLVAGAALVLAGPAPAAFPGDVGRIAFSSQGDLWSVNPDGTGLQRLTTSPEDDAQAAYSPDGRRIAYRRRPAAGQAYQVYVMRSDGSDVRRVSQSGVNESQPGWSADGTRIAFRRGAVGDANADVWIMNADGSGSHAAVVSAGADERYPVFSPDGTRLAFTSSREGAQYDVYVSAADGSGPVRRTTDPGYDSAPAWSPDGTKLAFERADAIDAETTKDVWVMRADGTSQTRLTATPGVDEGPAFSADGARIAFTSARDGDQEISVMHADGSAPARVLTRPSTLEESPDWQAVPKSSGPSGPPGVTVPTVPTVPTPPGGPPENASDRDGDGLSAPREQRLGTSDIDRDSDDDGLTDVREVRHTHTDPDRRDTDGDRVHDGTELGARRPIADPAGRVRGTDRRRFVRDADPRTRTNARRRDTDRDGRSDGREDRDRNGRVDRGETDPRRRGR